jgi:hypothetical protein
LNVAKMAANSFLLTSYMRQYTYEEGNVLRNHVDKQRETELAFWSICQNRSGKLDHKRVERTLLHKKIGLFGYSREFAKYGIVSPYMQVVFIGRIIEEQMKRAERLPSVSDNTEVNRWLQKAVEKQVNSEKDEAAKLEPLPHLALSTARLVAWDPYRDFAELLNAYCGPRAYQNAANKLSRLGYRVSIADLSDLSLNRSSH